MSDTPPIYLSGAGKFRVDDAVITIFSCIPPPSSELSKGAGTLHPAEVDAVVRVLDAGDTSSCNLTRLMRWR